MAEPLRPEWTPVDTIQVKCACWHAAAAWRGRGSSCWSQGGHRSEGILRASASPALTVLPPAGLQDTGCGDGPGRAAPSAGGGLGPRVLRGEGLAAIKSLDLWALGVTPASGSSLLTGEVLPSESAQPVPRPSPVWAGLGGGHLDRRPPCGVGATEGKAPGCRAHIGPKFRAPDSVPSGLCVAEGTQALQSEAGRAPPLDHRPPCRKSPGLVPVQRGWAGAPWLGSGPPVFTSVLPRGRISTLTLDPPS